MSTAMPETPAAQALDRWIVVQAQPHRENLALENLQRQGFVAYCPMIKKRVRHARKVQDVRRPLFPGYLFVAFRAGGPSWRPVLGTYGVRTIVRQGDRPGLIDGAFVEALRAREDDGIVRPPARQFEVGQQVAVEGGPLDGLIGRIVGMRDQDRIIVLLSLFNQDVKTEVSPTNLR